MTDEDSGTWIDPGNGAPVSMQHIIERIHSNKCYTVHIGTDSHRVKGESVSHTFATVICLYEQGKGADYYFKRVKKPGKYSSLRQRIMDEVSFSIDTAIDLMQHVPHNSIFVHADVNSDPRHKTFNFLSPIQSWVASAGFKFKCKPESWASSGVADKHAK